MQQGIDVDVDVDVVQGIDVGVDVVQQGIGRNWSNLGSAHSKSASGALLSLNILSRVNIAGIHFGTVLESVDLSGVRREFVKIGRIVGVT